MKPTPPPLAFLDTETTGLHVERGHQPWEVGLVLWDQVGRRVVGESYWQLPVNEHAADPEALAMNGWHERRFPTEKLTPRAVFAKELHGLVAGLPLVGANPAFDERMLAPIFHRWGPDHCTPWHYRPVDIEATMFGFFHGRRDALAPFDGLLDDGTPVVAYQLPESPGRPHGSPRPWAYPATRTRSTRLWATHGGRSPSGRPSPRWPRASSRRKDPTMGETTGIAWTDHTFNPWWGCVKIDAPADEPSECDHCYADDQSKRFGFNEGGGNGPNLWGKDSDRRFFGDKHWNEPRKWDRLAAEAGVTDVVFCASMADVFEARDDLDEHRARLWELIEETPNLVWQLLTKRPEQVVRRVPPSWMDSWPSNAGLGVSAGTQRSADLRVPRLLGIDAPIPFRFLSCEPLLTAVDLTHIDTRDRVDGMYWINALTGRNTDMGRPCADVRSVDWVIVGGESGGKHRAMDLDWARSLVAQCRTHQVPVFFKQTGGRFGGEHTLDGETIQEFPLDLGARHDQAVTLG